MFVILMYCGDTFYIGYVLLDNYLMVLPTLLSLIVPILDACWEYIVWLASYFHRFTGQNIVSYLLHWRFFALVHSSEKWNDNFRYCAPVMLDNLTFVVGWTYRKAKLRSVTKMFCSYLSMVELRQKGASSKRQSKGHKLKYKSSTNFPQLSSTFPLPCQSGIFMIV